ncbi:MAG TPA: hypothetical protein VH253_00725 [Phycisphaerae bacterium]|nr:hypothetical protein [Phycisphaerae bacterium]
MSSQAQDSHPDDVLHALVGSVVVLDTQGPLLYVGTLQRVAAGLLHLAHADVHDVNDSRASKDLYLVETRDLGVRVNRAAVIVMRSQVASVSLLADVRN